MPTVEMNRMWWDGANADAQWSRAGEEWSDAYGDPGTQWFGSLLPRIHRFVPAATILEIAPGFGRWTQYLHRLADRLITVDISERCIQACQARFKQIRNIEYHINDGRSLAMVDRHSVDFVFSFDSLVHVEADVIGDYLGQLSHILGPQGVAFIHHSNLGEFARYFTRLERMTRGRGLLARIGLVEGGDHKRAKSVSAGVFKKLAEGCGLAGRKSGNHQLAIQASYRLHHGADAPWLTVGVQLSSGSEYTIRRRGRLPKALGEAIRIRCAEGGIRAEL